MESYFFLNEQVPVYGSEKDMLHDVSSIVPAPAESPRGVFDQQAAEQVSRLLRHPAGKPDVLGQDVAEHYLVVLQRYWVREIVLNCLA